MARASEYGPSVEGVIGEAEVQAFLAHQGRPAQEGAEPSAGTSSSPSEKKLEWSGGSAPATESSLQSPAPETGSPSSPDPAASPVPSFTAPLTDGSTPETGSGQPSPQDSLAGALVMESTVTPGLDLTSGPSEEVPAAGGFLSGPEQAQKLMADAHTAFLAGDYDTADSLLNAAEEADPTVSHEIEIAHAAVEAYRSAQN